LVYYKLERRKRLCANQLLAVYEKCRRAIYAKAISLVLVGADSRGHDTAVKARIKSSSVNINHVNLPV